MKKTFAVACGLGIFGIASAFAADLPAQTYTKAPVAPVAYNWTGFYVGGNVGGAWSDDNSLQFGYDNLASQRVLLGTGLHSSAGNAFVTSPITFDTGRRSGIVGGLQAGYNFQFNRNGVAGVEADFNGANLQGSATFPQVGGDPLINTNMVASRSLDWFSTVRGRLGFTPSERLLVFGTGGLAVGREKVSAGINNLDPGTFATGFFPADGSSIDCFGQSPCAAGSRSQTSVGWVVGGGIEYALWSNFSIKAEYLYMDLGRITAHMGPVIIPAFINTPAIEANFGEGRYNILRIGMNYKFGGPIIAKY